MLAARACGRWCRSRSSPMPCVPLIFCILARNWLTLSLEWKRCAGIVTFGGWVLLTNLVTFLARNFDNLLIGTVLGAAAVGLYGLSYQFMMIPMIAVTWPASGVLFATLSRGGYDEDHAERITLAIDRRHGGDHLSADDLPQPGLSRTGQESRSRRNGRASARSSAWLAPARCALQSIAAYNGALLLVAGKARAQFLYSVLNTVATMAVLPRSASSGGSPGWSRRWHADRARSCRSGFLALIIGVARLHWLKLARALDARRACSTCGGARSWPCPVPFVARQASAGALYRAGGWADALAVLAVYGLCSSASSKAGGRSSPAAVRLRSGRRLTIAVVERGGCGHRIS
jgi:hypothetical protein